MTESKAAPQGTQVRLKCRALDLRRSEAEHVFIVRADTIWVRKPDGNWTVDHRLNRAVADKVFRLAEQANLPTARGSMAATAAKAAPTTSATATKAAPTTSATATKAAPTASATAAKAAPSTSGTASPAPAVNVKTATLDQLRKMVVEARKAAEAAERAAKAAEASALAARRAADEAEDLLKEAEQSEQARLIQEVTRLQTRQQDAQKRQDAAQQSERTDRDRMTAANRRLAICRANMPSSAKGGVTAATPAKA